MNLKDLQTSQKLLKEALLLIRSHAHDVEPAEIMGVAQSIETVLGLINVGIAHANYINLIDSRLPSPPELD